MLWNFLLTWLVTAVGLLILARLPLGLELKDTRTAFVAALVLGLLNAIVAPVLRFLAFPITLLTLGLFLFVISAFVLWLASALVRGFRLRGCLAALLNALLLSLLTSVTMAILT